MKLASLRPLATLGLALALAMPAYAAKPKSKPKAVPAAVAAPQILAATADSSLEILGDSTLHKWEAKAGKLFIGASLSPGAPSLFNGIEKGLLKGLSLSAEVAGLKSNESEKMDKNMRSAMESGKFTAVTFVMSGYELKGDEVLARGSLTIHGVSKDVELTGKISAKGEGVSVQGHFELLMSAYGIKPPVMMLGTVRVADKVSIAYDFTLKP